MKKSISSLCASLVFCAMANAAPLEFFPFDSGVGRDKPEWTPERQSAILKELGYDGIGYNYKGPQKLAEWQKAFDAQGLKIFSIYLGVTLGQPAPDLKDALALLKGRKTYIWMTIMKPKKEGAPGDAASAPSDSMDQEVVELIENVCAQAKEYGVDVVLYGHWNYYAETAEDGLRLMKKADCDNLYISMNLCHELAVGNAPRLGEIAAKCAPYLRLVSINGADSSNLTQIPQSILRLDKGDFDVAGFIKSLRDSVYKGPVGLQCFQVPGEVRENLTADMEAWKSISARSDSTK